MCLHVRADLSGSGNGPRFVPCSAECLDENMNVSFHSQSQVQSSLEKLSVTCQNHKKLFNNSQQCYILQIPVSSGGGVESQLFTFGK